MGGGGSNWHPTPQGKTTFKKPSPIRVKNKRNEPVSRGQVEHDHSVSFNNLDVTFNLIGSSYRPFNKTKKWNKLYR